MHICNALVIFLVRGLIKTLLCCHVVTAAACSGGFFSMKATPHGFPSHLLTPEVAPLRARPPAFVQPILATPLVHPTQHPSWLRHPTLATPPDSPHLACPTWLMPLEHPTWQKSTPPHPTLHTPPPSLPPPTPTHSPYQADTSI